MYAATTKDEGNAADGRFSTACSSLTGGSDRDGQNHLRGSLILQEIERHLLKIGLSGGK
jgi:hypothetical protein